MDFKKLPEENEYSYVYRLGQNKELIGTWQDVADILNSELGYEYTESRYRKMYQAFEKMMEANYVKFEGTDAFASDIIEQKMELEKERVRLRDERNEMNRIIREQARNKTLVETIKEAIRTEVAAYPGYEPHQNVTSDNDLIVHLTDIHGGLETKNFANKYDEETLYDRLACYLGKIIDVQEMHNSESCYVLLGGDLISGVIHSNLRLENNLNVIEQVKMVAGAITRFLSILSEYFNLVEVRSVPGNHSRCLPVKDENFKGENLDNLIFWYLQASLSQYENVKFFENSEDSLAVFNVRGYTVYGVHGDKDNISSIVQNLTLFTGEQPDIVMAGHRHTNGLTTVYDTKVVESGCVSGPDNFCMDHRLKNKPEQMILVVNDKGLDCLYDVTL